jgi:carboxylesterase
MNAAVIEGAEAWDATGTGARAAVGVVVVHGFTGNPLSTRPMGERLHADGYTVRVPRLPGHGTTAKDMATTRYADWLAEVETQVDAMQGRCDQVVLVGLSMGGTLCLDVGSRRDVAGVVAINTPILDRDGVLAKVAPILAYVLPMVPAKLAGLVEDDIAKPGVTEKAYDTIPAKSANSFLKALPRIRAQLRELTVPVIVAYSPQDHSVPPENSKALAGLLGSTDVRELILTQSYHVATLDLDQQLLEDTVSSFVAEVTGV